MAELKRNAYLAQDKGFINNCATAFLVPYALPFGIPVSPDLSPTKVIGAVPCAMEGLREDLEGLKKTHFKLSGSHILYWPISPS
jgi:hypothetical protein